MNVKLEKKLKERKKEDFYVLKFSGIQLKGIF
jgi:hypothetical protein